MKSIKFLSVFFLAATLLAGCGGGGGGGGTTAPAAGALDAGGSGVTLSQIDDGTGTLVTASFVSAVGINDNLQIIGYAQVTPGGPLAASLWAVDTAGGITVTPTPLANLAGGSSTAAFAIDTAGSPVGRADDGTRQAAVIWAAGGTPVALPQLAAGGDYAAHAISADGTLIAGVATDGSGLSRAVLWTADGGGNFTTPPTVLPVNIFARGTDLSQYSLASGIARVPATNEILVAGEAEAGDGILHAALWRSTDGGATFGAIDLGAGYVAIAVNGNRQVVGETETGPAPVRWTVSAGGVASAPTSLATAGSAVAINSNGRIAGWSGAADRATVWNGTTPTTLFTTESRAFGLNNDAEPMVVGRNGSTAFVKRIN